MFMKNKYTKWYESIIHSAQRRGKLESYCELHHVIPKSLGGDATKSNLVWLTGREHYVCHLLLTKMVEGAARKKMLYAFMLMSTHGLNRNGESRQFKKLNNRLFQKLRQDFSNAISESRRGKSIFPKDPIATAAKQSAKLKGRTFSDETKRKMSESAKARKRQPLSEQTKLKISKANTGRIITDETRQKMSHARKQRVYHRS
jgi:hypothetical protein